MGYRHHYYSCLKGLVLELNSIKYPLKSQLCSLDNKSKVEQLLVCALQLTSPITMRAYPNSRVNKCLKKKNTDFRYLIFCLQTSYRRFQTFIVFDCFAFVFLGFQAFSFQDCCVLSAFELFHLAFSLSVFQPFGLLILQLSGFSLLA